MFKVFGVSLVLTVLAGLGIGLIGKTFVLGIGVTMLLAFVAATAIGMLYTLPAFAAYKASISTGIGGNDNTKVS